MIDIREGLIIGIVFFGGLMGLIALMFSQMDKDEEKEK